MEREVGGGIGMGNTCKPMADSFQCMTKPTTIKKKKKERKEKKKRKRALNARLRKKDQGAAPFSCTQKASKLVASVARIREEPNNMKENGFLYLTKQF